jgi:hypothetical protein
MPRDTWHACHKFVRPGQYKRSFPPVLSLNTVLSFHKIWIANIGLWKEAGTHSIAIWDSIGGSDQATDWSDRYEQRLSSSPQSSDRLCGLLRFCSIGTEALALEAKRPWREAKHSPQFSAKVKDECSYYAIPLHDCMASTGTVLQLFPKI